MACLRLRISERFDALIAARLLPLANFPPSSYVAPSIRGWECFMKTVIAIFAACAALGGCGSSAVTDLTSADASVGSAAQSSATRAHAGAALAFANTQVATAASLSSYPGYFQKYDDANENVPLSAVKKAWGASIGTAQGYPVYLVPDGHVVAIENLFGDDTYVGAFLDCGNLDAAALAFADSRVADAAQLSNYPGYFQKYVAKNQNVPVTAVKQAWGASIGTAQGYPIYLVSDGHVVAIESLFGDETQVGAFLDCGSL
jgi:hypothetical protein